MPSRVTITGTLGPDQDVTSLVLNNVSNLDFQLARSVLQVTQSDPSKITDFDLKITGTVTVTIASSVATVTVS